MRPFLARLRFLLPASIYNTLWQCYLARISGAHSYEPPRLMSIDSHYHAGILGI